MKIEKLKEKYRTAIALLDAAANEDGNVHIDGIGGRVVYTTFSQNPFADELLETVTEYYFAIRPCRRLKVYKDGDAVWQ